MTKPKYTKTPEGQRARLAARRAKGYENARKRWPEGMQTKEPPRVIADALEEDIWLAEAELHVVGFDKLSRGEQRRAAKRLLEAQMIRETVAAETGSEPPAGVDDETREVYWRREGDLQRERVAHDERMAARHRAAAERADRQLAYLLMRREASR